MSTSDVTVQKVTAGILIVGLGGNNGVTLLAGQIANRRALSWETSTSGRISANWFGCLTQIPPRGVYGRGVGFQGRYPGLASANDAKIGGWDIRSTKLGQALYDCRVLEPDLVRQVREEMDGVEIMKGVWDPSFIGESQHATATHVVTGEDDASTRTRVEKIRRDIRSWRKNNNVAGHVTVIWSASVERPTDTDYHSPDDLLNAIYDDDNDDDISPSMLYAVAAVLEGCSFVNGGSQNTLSPAMTALFHQSYRQLDANPSSALSKFAPYSTNRAYVLGTDFKAGQTKFKTAAVEYLRALGLSPRVIASSNHLGNNDMLNLTTKKTLSAKMRVKSDIFGPWQEENLDHKVTVMYTPYIGDEKRDFVEYTSLGFLGSPHTMVTYTRCMDSILCVPLMVDAAIWCDYFVKHNVSPEDAARATAYLFKVPEGEAKGVDPGFFHQMSQLEDVLEKASSVKAGNGKKRKHEEVHANQNGAEVIALGLSKGIITMEQASALRVLAAQK